MFSLKLLLLKTTLRPLFMEFLWMGFNCLKATEPPQRGSLFFITRATRTFWYSFSQPQKDEKLS